MKRKETEWNKSEKQRMTSQPGPLTTEYTLAMIPTALPWPK